MNEKEENKNLGNNQDSEKQALAVFIWLFICIVMIITGFFIADSPWINLFYWVAAFFGGSGFGLRFSKDENDKDVGAVFIVIASIITFINSLAISAGLFALIAIALFIRYTIVLKKSLSAEKTPEETGEEIKAINELPEEDEPEIASSEIFSEDGIEIQPAITYFAQIKRRYKIEQESWLPIREQLIHIKRRLNDETLYLGVIGEASAGKSTFINALLGFEFLKEDTDLGTTVASTILRHGKEVSVNVTYLDDEKNEYLDAKALGISEKDKIETWGPKLLDVIHKYTADEEIAVGIHSVNVTLPIENALLQSGVAIVDTPGVNSRNARHNDVTTRAICEICDTALILVPANVPLSESLAKYISANLSNVLDRCVLLMTQADKLRRAKERSMQLKYITSRLKSATGKEIAASYSTSAYYVLNRDDYGNADENTVSQYREEFAQMADSLKKIIVDCRHSAILEKLLFFVNNSLLPLLTDLIKKKKQEYTRRKKSLEENQLTDIDKFTQTEFALHQKDISDVIVSESQIVSELSKVRTIFLDNMRRIIYNADDRDDLKSAMAEDVIKRELSKLQSPLKKTLNELAEPYRNALSAAMEEVHNNFSKEYQKLEQISRQQSTSSFSKVNDNLVNISVSVSDFGSQIDSQLGADVMKSVGGAGAGAMIGSFICPGLGTLIGGVLGGIFGALFGKSLDELKKDAYDSICSVGNDWLAQMISQANEYMDSYQDAATNMLAEGIGAYKNEYGEKISSMIQAEKDEQNKLQKMTQIAKNDLDLFKKVHSEAESMIQASRVHEETGEPENTTEHKS